MALETTKLSMSRPQRARQAPPNPAAIGPGVLIGDNLRIERELGAGGMSRVYLATDKSLDRRVALKFLAHDLLGDAEWRERFAAEARNMARVHHPNVMQIHSYGEHLGWPYFVMDHVEGVTLAQWRAQRARPSLSEVAALVSQIAAGLEAMHAAGLAHLDVKPANVLVDASGRVIVMDLGLSRLVSRDHGAPPTAGTPCYMAPEQTVAASSSPELMRRIDVYQLGVTAFELLVGNVPFDDPQIESVLARHRTERPAAPSQARPDIGIEADEAVLGALEKDPLDRPSTPSEFAAALGMAAAPSSFSRRYTERGAEHLRVLVAEDDPGQLRATCALLTQALPEGTRIEGVADGALALEATERTAFDVVLLDLNMPWMGGHDVAAALGVTGGPRPCIIVMSASGGADDWQELRARGVDAMLLKPFDIQDVVSIIERHVR